MTFSMVLRTLFEFLLVAAVVWGFFNEDRLVAFENRIGAYFRRKSLRVIKTQKQCDGLKIVNG